MNIQLSMVIGQREIAWGFATAKVTPTEPETDEVEHVELHSETERATVIGFRRNDEWEDEG